MPSLVPRVFENTRPENNTPSRGLAGELPVVIAMMAFHGRVGEASDVFSRGLWRRNQWLGSGRAPAGCKFFLVLSCSPYH